jgi:hypothetical protein
MIRKKTNTHIQIGALLPVDSTWKTKSKVTNIILGENRTVAWYILECGIRVCAELKNNKPFLWVKLEKSSTYGKVYKIVDKLVGGK